MKKILLLVTALFPVLATAQVVSEGITVSKMPDSLNFERTWFSAMDMKIFHDRQIMQNAILQLAEQQDFPMTAASGERDKMTAGIFSERDSDILETTLDNRRLHYDLGPELFEKAGKMPFEAFKDVIMGANIPKISTEEMDKLNQVDEKVIPQMMQLITESGPDVGNRPVSVKYGNET